MDHNKIHLDDHDVCIIGGGIAGFSTAYWLLKEDPTLRIVLLEKYRLGDGATGRNAGFITCGSVEHFNRLVSKHGVAEATEIWQFSEENLRSLKEEIVQNDAAAIEFQTQGSFSLASTEHELEQLIDSAHLMAQSQIRVQQMKAMEIHQRLGAQGFTGGIKYIDDASVHPLKLLRLVHERINERYPNQLKVLENAEVYSIEEQGSLRQVLFRGGSVSSSSLVFATNAYSSLLNPYFKDKIFPTRGQILATSPLPLFMEGPCYANFVLDYFRQLPTGEFLIGGFRQLQKDTELGFSDEISSVIQEALQNFMNQHLPALRGVKITYRWSGVMGFSVDGQPMVGSLPDDPQIFFLGGFTGHGLGLAFQSAKTLVDLMFERNVPAFISAKRFTK